MPKWIRVDPSWGVAKLCFPRAGRDPGLGTLPHELKPTASVCTGPTKPTGDATMAENQDKPKTQQIQLRIDESKMVSTYANTIRTSTTTDEVVMDFGMNLPVQGPDNQAALMFNVGSRIIMNWAGAKRLAITLGQVVRQYEERNGEIRLPTPGQPAEESDKPKLAD